MTEEEFDLQLTRRIGAYAHTKRLPEDFAGRFVGTLRRRRRVRRAKLAVAVACLALAFLFVLGMTDRPSAAGAAEPALVAATAGHGPTEQISGFLFLGFSRAEEGGRVNGVSEFVLGGTCKTPAETSAALPYLREGFAIASLTLNVKSRRTE